MIITVLRARDLFNFALPDKASGQYLIYMDSGLLAGAISSIGGNWVLSLEKGFRFAAAPDHKDGQCIIRENISITIQEESSGKYLYLMSETSSKECATFTKYYLPQYGEYRIGRGSGMDIKLTSQLISEHHATVVFDKTGSWIEDKGTPNGTYVNGIRISTKTKLHDGDLIYIVGLKIAYASQLLAINHPNDSLSISNRLSKVALQPANNPDNSDHAESKIAKKFFRSPRFANHIPTYELKLDPPPAPVEIQSMPLAYVLGPSITMGLASVITAVFTILNANGDILRIMPTLVMSFSMLTMTVLWPILTKKYEKKRRIEAEKARIESYTKYIAESRQKILAAIASQEQILNANYPPVDKITERVFQLDRSLWERSPWHSDYLSVRLGIGSRKLIGKISCPEKKFKVRTDDLEDKMYQLAGVDYRLNNVPITVKLDEVITGVIGNRASVRDMMRVIIGQLITLHSYDECKLYVEYDRSEEAYWRFLYDVPHCWDSEFENRNIISSSGDLGVALPALSKIFEERKSEFETGNKRDFDTRYVILLLDRNIIATNAVIRSILDYKEYLGISIIAAFDELKYLPRNCTQIIEVGQTEARLFNRYSDQEAYTSFTPDFCKTDLDAMARAMANIYSDNAQKQNELPNLISFLEMMKVGRVEQLNCATRWREHNASQSIDAELGVDEQGSPFILNLHEKSHGPHGLIAGMTGSGKSELIMTMILSLAVNYHPYDVAFILIDFKGGGMAKAFEKLPHTVGIITNLDGNEIKRSLASINSELRKRQTLFATAASIAGESNIDIYKYQQLYRSGVVAEPLPHLFIISDEFAELKSQHPDFMAELISAARIGRSLGVHLILATQKPSGVVDDQIWSNSKFRICLKVQDRADSQDVIKRPDAAELNTTGRFYLQVGYNELFETGQSAWSGAPYIPSDVVKKKNDENLIVVNKLGHQIMSVAPEKSMGLNKVFGKQIDATVKYLAALANAEGISLHTMWKSPLPESIEVESITETTYPDRIAATCGIVDDPSNQDQYPLTVDISKGGNTLIYGISGSGRTTFLCTLIHQLITHYPPDLLNVHLVDCGSGSLNAFHEAPHIGYSVSMSDASEMDNLFKSLKKEIIRRKELFAKIGGEYGTYYTGGNKDIPCMVVVINNYAGFYEVYNEKEDDMASLTREGSKYGIYFVIAATAGGSVRNRVAQNFKQVFVLQMNDRIDYSAILGSTGGVYPQDNPGRGIFKLGQQSYEFQTAYVHDTNDYNRFAFFSETAQKLLQRNGGNKASNLKEKVLALNYASFLGDCKLTGIDRKIPIGIDSDTDGKLFLTFNSNVIVPIMSAAKQQIGFSRQFLRLLADGNVETYVFDTDNVLALPDKNNLRYIKDATCVNEEISKLVTKVVGRFKAKKSNAVQSESDFPPLVIFINNYSSLDALLNKDVKPRFYDMLENGAALSTMIIISGTPSTVSSFAANKWYRKRFSHTDGLWIGPGYDQQNIFTSARPFSQTDIKDDSCYLLNGGVLQYGRRLMENSDEHGRDQHE